MTAKKELDRSTRTVVGLRKLYLALLVVTSLLIITGVFFNRVQVTVVGKNLISFEATGISPNDTLNLQLPDLPALQSVKQSNKQFLKPFLYLTQAKQCIHPLKASSEQIGDPKTCNCDVIVLSYGNECREKGNASHITYLFDTTTTWASGRNVLYYAAMKRKPGYHYYIFMDGDTVLNFNDYTPSEMKKLAPFRAFQEWLLDYEPALGVSNYARLSAKDAFLRREKLCGINDNKTLVLPIVRFDGCLNAYHYKAVSHVLPYPVLDRQMSWYIPNKHIMSAVELKFRGQAMMFVPVTIRNIGHTSYPKAVASSLLAQLWRGFINKIRAKAPLVHRDHPIWKEFGEKLEKYQKTSQTHCLNTTRHLPIKPYAHFDRESL